MADLDELANIITQETAVMLYFGAPSCGVCNVLKPKIKALMDEQFPKIKWVYIDCNEQPEIAAQYSIFNVPVVVVYFEGKEWLREVRNISLGALEDAIRRPYEMMMS